MQIHHWVRSICLVVTGLLLCTELRAQVPFALKDSMNALQVAGRSPISLSPNGAWVAFAACNASGSGGIADSRYMYFTRSGMSTETKGCTVLVASTKTGRTTHVASIDATSWGPEWSPDGTALAFYSDQSGEARVWIWNLATEKARVVSDAIPRAFFGFEVPQWTPDGKHILTKILPEGITLEAAAREFARRDPLMNRERSGLSALAFSSTGKPGIAKASVTAADDPRALLWHLGDLASIDVKTGAVRRIARNQHAECYFLSPDGRHVVYADVLGRDRNGGEMLHDIKVVSVADPSPQPRVVASHVEIPYGDMISWSPDGTKIAFVSGRYGSQGVVVQGRSGDVNVVTLDGAAPRNLTPGVHPNFANYHYQQPMWSRDGRHIFVIGDGNLWSLSTGRDGALRNLTSALGREVLAIIDPGRMGVAGSPDNRSVYVATLDKESKKEGLARVDGNSGRILGASEGDMSIDSAVFGSDISEGARAIAYVAETASREADIWLTSTDLLGSRRITDLNPELDEYVMGTSRLVEYSGMDGQKLRGAVLLPPGYRAGKRYPVIVTVYGGHTASDDVNEFGLTGSGPTNFQLLATRGYVVFAPDMPLRVGTPMRDIYDTVMPGVNRLVDLGIADPDRLGVTGVSYGGYSVLALLVQTNRFKAAVSISGFGNLIALYGWDSGPALSGFTGYFEGGQGRMEGSPWQFRDRYIENSPYFYLDRVTTPVMLVGGAQDAMLPPFLLDEVFGGLRRLKKRAVYVEYMHGGHGAESLDDVDGEDYFRRMTAWFDRYLRPHRVSVTARKDW